MKTAVEWLVEQMRLRRDEGLSLSFYDLEMFAKKAEQMEKEQMIDFAFQFRENEIHITDIERVYNETFKNTNE